MIDTNEVLLKLADELEVLKPDRLTLGNWSEQDEVGFSGCVGGWLIHNHGAELQLAVADDDEGRGFYVDLVTNLDVSGFDATWFLGTRLGVTEDEAYDLFNWGQAHAFYEIELGEDLHPQQAAARLRRFVTERQFEHVVV